MERRKRFIAIKKTDLEEMSKKIDNALAISKVCFFITCLNAIIVLSFVGSYFFQ
tara:strand:+ start:824 stop:985 length:162 start_codon:yes stop_codon:yes gene_type:complete